MEEFKSNCSRSTLYLTQSANTILGFVIRHSIDILMFTSLSNSAKIINFHTRGVSGSKRLSSGTSLSNLTSDKCSADGVLSVGKECEFLDSM